MRKVIIYVFILPAREKTVTEIVCLIDGCVITMLSYKIEGVNASDNVSPHLRVNLIYVYLVSV